VQQFITNYGYLAIFVLMLAESACIPVPSELIMTFGGALAAGAVPGTHLNLIGVILAGTAGNVAGSYIAWAVGRYGGQPLLRRLSEGRLGRRLLREHDLDRAIAWFDRHGGKAVLIGRLLPVVRWQARVFGVVFDDREGFGTLCGTKSFVIMKRRTATPAR